MTGKICDALGKRGLAAMIGSVLVAATALAGEAFAAPPGPLKFGVYDPEGSFTSDPNVDIEHLFLPWEDVDLASIPLADAYAQERNRTLLVTIEPWTWSRDERNTPEYLRWGIDSGIYDENMRSICSVLTTLNSPVTVRWGHEMDDLSGQFIWAGWNPQTYLRAYKRMVDVCRSVASNLNYMWSPLGEETLTDYCPEEVYFDSVGLSVFGLQEWDQDKFGRDRSFKEILQPRYDLAVQCGKPVFVAELGYVGSQGYVDTWENEVRQSYAEFPDLVGVVYFNQKEVYPWPENYGYPDWRVDQRVIK